MQPDGLIGRLHQADEQVQQVRAVLLAPTPEALEQSLPFLDSAIHCLEGLSGVEDRGGSVVAAAQSLRRQVRQCSLLLESAARFHLGWRCVLASMCAGYTAEGGPAPLPAEGQVSVRG